MPNQTTQEDGPFIGTDGKAYACLADRLIDKPARLADNVNEYLAEKLKRGQLKPGDSARLFVATPKRA